MTDGIVVGAWGTYDGKPVHIPSLNTGFDAGVIEGIRRAREAAMNVDPIESALGGSDAAVAAIDALKDTE